MNDPGGRIARICYCVETASGEDYDPEVTAVGTLGPFSYHLRARIATLTPATDLANEAVARKLLDPLVAAWNVEALLTLGPGAFQLQYIHTVVDNQSGPIVCAHVAQQEAKSPPAHLIHTEYPAAPVDMLADRDVVALAEEYSRLLREPARLVLGGRTVVELLDRRFSDRRAAAEALCADVRVLNKLAEITSSWGRRPGADKITTWKGKRRISKAERQWIINILRALTRRLAQHVAGRKPTTLLDRLP